MSLITDFAFALAFFEFILLIVMFRREWERLSHERKEIDRRFEEKRKRVEQHFSEVREDLKRSKERMDL